MPLDAEYRTDTQDTILHKTDSLDHGVISLETYSWTAKGWSRHFKML